MTFALLLLSVACAPAQASEPLPVSSRLDRVTVYEGQALVERIFEVQANESGRLTVALAPLPLYLDTTSFQAKVERGPAFIEGLDTRSVTGDALDRAERARLLSELQGLKAERRAIDAEFASIAAGEEVVQTLISSLGGPVGSPSAVMNAILEGGDFEAIGKLLVFVRERAAELDRERAEAERGALALDLRIGALEEQVGTEESPRLRTYLEGRVQMAFDRPGTASVRASYLVSGAAWRPAYDVRVAPDLTGVTVGLVAEVAQNTGEDWAEVELHLSSSAPPVALAAPEVSVRVFLESPRRSDSARRVPEDGFGAGSGARGTPYLPFGSTPMSEMGLSLVYRLSERHTLPSDGEPLRFKIRELPLKVRPHRYVVPTRSEVAFLRAEILLQGEDTLLQGQAKVFLGPDYLGEQTIPVLRPGATTLLELGIDPNLSVAHEKVVDERDDPGWLASEVEITRVWRATLKLLPTAPGPVEVLVEESIPGTRSDEIRVKPTQMQPDPLDDAESKQLQEDLRQYRWRFTLAPGQRQNVKWGYVVSFDESIEPELVERD